MNWISVTDAANRLDCTPRQVRRLAARHQLGAQRVGRIWLVDAQDVADRARADIAAGRPLSEHSAWAALAALEAALIDDDVHLPPWLSAQQRWRLNAAFAQGPPVTRWAQWTRRRSQPRRLWVHPGVVPHLTGDPRVRSAGRRAAALLGLTAARVVHLYVDVDDAAAVEATWHARPATDGQVVLHAVHFDVVPLEELPLLAAELTCGLEDPDARTRMLARDAVGDALARLRAR